MADTVEHIVSLDGIKKGDLAFLGVVVHTLPPDIAIVEQGDESLVGVITPSDNWLVLTTSQSRPGVPSLLPLSILVTDTFFLSSSSSSLDIARLHPMCIRKGLFRATL
jgi:hypothetical protein